MTINLLMLISPVSGGDCADQREESWRVCGKDPPFLLVCRSQIREREREREREGERDRETETETERQGDRQKS